MFIFIITLQRRMELDLQTREKDMFHVKNKQRTNYNIRAVTAFSRGFLKSFVFKN